MQKQIKKNCWFRDTKQVVKGRGQQIGKNHWAFPDSTTIITASYRVSHWWRQLGRFDCLWIEYWSELMYNALKRAYAARSRERNGSADHEWAALNTFDFMDGCFDDSPACYCKLRKKSSTYFNQVNPLTEKWDAIWITWRRDLSWVKTFLSIFRLRSYNKDRSCKARVNNDMDCKPHVHWTVCGERKSGSEVLLSAH